MKLSRTVAYALQATLLLAESGSKSPIPCSKLAARGQMPERFLLQILRSLVTHGILESTRGVEGGYTLRRPLEGVSLLELIEAIDGPLDPKIPLGAKLPDGPEQRLGDALRRITTTARSQLEAIKLSSLLSPPSHLGKEHSVPH